MTSLARSALPNALLYAVSRLRRRPPGPAPKRLGIYKVDRLGDFVLALGAIRLLVARHGVEHCVLIGSRFSAELAAQEFPGLEVVMFSCGHNQLWKTKAELHRLRHHPLLRAGVADLVCLRHHRTLHDDVLLGAIPAGRTWGSGNSTLTDADEQLAQSRLQFDRVVSCPEPAPDECRELTLHRALAGAVLGEALAPARTLPDFVSAEATSEPYAGISPFGSAQIRDITPRQLLGVCGELGAQGLEIRLWAEPRQKERYETLAANLNRQSAFRTKVTITGNMDALIAEVARARVVISAETVTAHIAAALDKPLVAFLGGGHYGWFAPWRRSTRQQWISHRTDCYGCNWHCHHPEPYCLTRIEDGQIRSAIRLALSMAVA